MQNRQKKGITPLMATLLLISFATAVGVVVINFSQAQVEDAAQCVIDINLKIPAVQGKDEICYDGTKKEIIFTVENGVNIKVEGLVVNIIGSEQAETFELNEATIPKAGVYLGKITYDSTTSGEIRQIKISPKIMPYDQELICVEKALIIELVKPC